jgi:AraC family transcriptional activator of pyochelin receptor
MQHITAMGLDIHSGAMSLRRGESWESRIEAGYWIGTVLRGEISAEQPWTTPQAWRPGTCMLFRADSPVSAMHQAQRDGEVAALFLRLRFDTIEHLVGPKGAELLEHGTRAGVHPCPALISMLAWQMQGCTLPPEAARLYITGKAMEIVAHVVADIVQAMKPATGAATLPPRETRQLHEAREILLANLGAPPSIPELARRVGTNARKLGEGFNTLFGSPVYAFVKARRLEEAKRLLESGETSVSAVARRLGYHPGHLSTEFRRRFGISPANLAGRREVPAE